MKRSTRPPFWLRALGLKMIGYLRGDFTSHSSPMRARFAIGFAADVVGGAMLSSVYGQNRKHLIDRQAHHIFKATVDALDDQLTMLLDAISAGLVERVNL